MKLTQKLEAEIRDLNNKLEKKNRALEIEASLEIVRAKTMAMHRSEDLLGVIKVISEQLKQLNFSFDSASFVLTNNPDQYEFWLAYPGQEVPVKIIVPFHPQLTRSVEAVKNGIDFLAEKLSFEEKNEWFNHLFEHSILKHIPQERKNYLLSTKGLARSIALMKNVALAITNYNSALYTEEENTIIKRFASVFEQSYTRFLDLHKAEAMAREAQVETALERVRARTMAMQKSEELPQAANLLFRQIKGLGINAWSTGYGIWTKARDGCTLWMSSEDVIQQPFLYPHTEDPVSVRFAKAASKGETLYVEEMGGEDLVSHYNYMRNLPLVGEMLAEIKKAGFDIPLFQIFHLAYFSHGYLLFITYEPVPDAYDIFKRFAKVFDLTYTRFNDLQKAEAQTKKANIETALERVRARALAMQQPEELMEVANVLREEMGLLGVEELETCSIYINDEANQRSECWYALKDIREPGKKLVTDYFSLDLESTWVGKEMIRFYNSEDLKVSINMTDEARKEWILYCENQSVLFREYNSDVIPDRIYHLYKFNYGAIGAATPAKISEESWELLRRTASVFSLAYSRFKDLAQARIDLQKLKQEKQRAETALTELRATQSQLVHAEKMASLGELTAGIAHEIQNPLNFVNNFSEVSSEMITEMTEGIENGELEEVKYLARDIKQNLDKISHHGKRADAIVKGMLLHSRTSTGQKELTDINALAEEYLRLAFHGLRAKDKSFNAKFETSLDSTIEKINIVPQEIGRVVLNLINNAFYAVSEKKLHQPEGYEPSVLINTKKLVNKIEIRVSDNGNGIPRPVLDKIFQPFFTTKPTGKGTGLGLSLSYDIIKSHGGELKVETKEGEKTEFIVSLPI